MDELTASTETGEASVVDTGYSSPEEMAEALLKKWDITEDTSETIPDGEGGEPQADPEEPSADGDDNLEFEEDEGREDPEETPKVPEKRRASDDDEVVVTVDGEETTVSVKDLRRLAGQEKALTRKSQEVAAARKAADDSNLVAFGVLNKLYEEAKKRAAPYENIDLWKANRELEPEEFESLQKQIGEARRDRQFFEAELSGFVDTLKADRAKFLKEASQAATQVLKERLPDWDAKLYDSIRTYAISEGLDAEMVNTLVDPNAIILIDKARRYDAAKARAKAKGGKPTAAAVPTTQARPNRAPAPVSADKATNALKRLRSSGSQEDAASLFLARWGIED